MPLKTKRKTLRKYFVSLPPRTIETPPNACGAHTIETRPELWQVKLLGRVAVPMTNEHCTVKIGKNTRSLRNETLLLLFQDEVSGKIFWWSERRSQSEHLTLKREGGTYHYWPQEMYQLTRRNYTFFKHLVYGFGAEANISDEELAKVIWQKKNLLKNLEEALQGD